jgi:hypothetical protein
MKKVLVFCALVIAGCSSEKVVDPIEVKVAEADSIIAHSQEVIEQAFIVNEKADSTVRVDVSKVINEIKAMNLEVQNLKAIQKIEKVRIDTVYIETKKNFWGKQKTKTTVVSDSTVIIDSLQN